MGSFQVLGDLYNALFTGQFSNPEILVDYEIWNRIKVSLPKNYSLPDTAFVEDFAKAFEG
jgi:hypothetical protein